MISYLEVAVLLALREYPTETRPPRARAHRTALLERDIGRLQYTSDQSQSALKFRLN